jgi:chromosomal replication initiation ATPase DnaA
MTALQEQMIDNLQAEVTRLHQTINIFCTQATKTRDFETREEEIISAVENHSRLMDITRKLRTRPYVKARSIAAWIMKLEGFSLQEIGDSMDLEHTSVLYLHRNHAPTDAEVQAIRERIS